MGKPGINNLNLFTQVERPQVGSNMPELPNLEAYPDIGFDCETTTEKLLWDRTMTGFGLYRPRMDGVPELARYISVRHPGGGNYDEGAVQRWAKDQLKNKTLVVANGKHEHHTLKKWGLDFEEQGCRFRDVFHKSALLSTKPRYKLNVNILLAEEFPEYIRTNVNHGDLYKMPADLVAPITIEDCKIAWMIDEVLGPRIEEQDLWTVLDLEDDLIFSTCEMERNGSYLDIELLMRYKREVSAEIEKRILQIYQLTGLRTNPRSPDDMSRILRYYGIHNPYRNEPTEDNPEGSECYDEDALLNLRVDNPQYTEILTVCIEVRQLMSFKSKYIDSYLASVHYDGRIYYALHQLRGDEGGTITGRYSSSKMFKSKDGGINIQQVVKTKKMPAVLKRWPVRKMFIAPPGRTYFSSDASQIEFRVFAHYASTVLGMDRIAEKYRNDHKTDFHDVVMQWTGQNRDITKNINFRKLYGGGPAKGMMMINRENKLNGTPLITLEDSERNDAEYDKAFPEAKKLLKIAENQAKTHGFVRTLLNRRGYFDVNNWEERFYKALNIVLQGGATGDLVKLKIRHMYRERKNLDIVMRSQVHDEVNGDTGGPENKDKIAEFMNEQEFPMKCPILWNTGVGPNWEDAK